MANGEGEVVESVLKAAKALPGCKDCAAHALMVALADASLAVVRHQEQKVADMEKNIVECTRLMNSVNDRLESTVKFDPLHNQKDLIRAIVGGGIVALQIISGILLGVSGPSQADTATEIRKQLKEQVVPELRRIFQDEDTGVKNPYFDLTVNERR